MFFFIFDALLVKCTFFCKGLRVRKQCHLEICLNIYYCFHEGKIFLYLSKISDLKETIEVFFFTEYIMFVSVIRSQSLLVTEYVIGVLVAQ